jgi:hypothetical protein
VDERQREIEPAFHATRVPGDLPVGCVGQPDALEQIVGAGAPLVLRHALKRRLEAQVVAPRQQRVERRLLESDADERADLRPVLDDVVAADASPEVGGSNVVRTCTVVDLPAPFGPRNP